MNEQETIEMLDQFREKVAFLADRVEKMEKTVGVDKSWPFPTDKFKQYDMSYEQVDAIVINELKETVAFNWHSDHKLVAAALTLLEYYLSSSDYVAFEEEINNNPPKEHEENYNY